MATTQTARGMDSVKGPYSGSPASTPMHLIRISVNVNGSYDHTARPSFDLAAALEASGHGGWTAVNVLWAKAFGDYNDGTNALTAANAGIALTSTGSNTNNVVTFQLQSGAVNGATGTEVADTTAINGDVGFIFGVQLTSGAVGAT